MRDDKKLQRFEERVSLTLPQISDALAGGAVHLDQITALLHLSHVRFGRQRACDAGYYIPSEEKRRVKR